MFWKVQGNIGGWTDFPDKTRGIFNVGGLAGEREGWYLPGFDTGWTDGVEWVDKPGVRFYRGLVEVDYPEGVDVHYRWVPLTQMILLPDRSGRSACWRMAVHGTKGLPYSWTTRAPIPDFSFVFPNATGGYRAQLYVNGWQFGRRYGDLGRYNIALISPNGLTKNHTQI